MKKVLLKILILCIAICSALCVFTACGGENDNNQVSVTEEIYYLIDDEFNINKSDYLIIQSNGKWRSSDNYSGNYVLEQYDYKIYYFTLSGEDTIIFVATIVDNYLTLVYGENNSVAFFIRGDVSGDIHIPTVQKVKVTYDANGGTINGNSLYEENVPVGSKLTAPNNPVRVGYTFTGWAFDRNGNKKCVFENEIISVNTVLYATWEEERAVILSVENASITERTVTLVVENAVTSVSFTEKITVSKNCTWKMYTNDAKTEIPTKIANNLKNGRNEYYIVVTSNDGQYFHTYTLYVCRVYNVNVYYRVGDTVVHNTVFQMYKENTVNYLPSVIGYNFNGWVDNNGTFLQNGTTLVLNEQNVSSFYYAHFTPIKYNVSYMLNGGVNNPQNPYTYNIESDTITLAEPEKEHYTFDGWYSDAGFTQRVYDIQTGSYGDKTFYAKWTPIDYDIAYETDGGINNTENPSKYNIETDTVTLAMPTKTGYTFVGWYSDAEFTYRITKIEKGSHGNKTLYAKWCKLNLTVNNSNAGSVTLLDKTYFAGEEVTVTATTKIGYTFIGWFEGDEKLTADLSYTFAMPSENKTYTAKWCKVTLSVNDISAGSVTTLNSTYTVGEEVTVTATTNTGYTFIGWFGGNEKLTDELSYTFVMPSVNKTYTAKWCKVTLSVNDSNAGSVTPLNSTYTVGEEITVTATTNTGYTFIGWFEGSEKLTDELSYTFVMPSVNKTYTAKWTYYTLTTSVNDGDAGTVSEYNQTKVTAGESVNIIATTNVGYTFIGWFEGSEKLTDELTYTFTMPSTNKTYTAKWTFYTLTTLINDNDAGTVSAYNQTKITAGDNVTITATTNKGYTFIGWFEGSEKLTDELSYTFTMPRANKTYTAKFGTIIYSITYQGDYDKSVSNPTSFTVKDLPINLNAPFNDNYLVNYWEYNGKEISTITVDYLTDLTLIANHYNLTYTKSNNSIAITGCSEGVKTLIIPETIDGSPVTSIAHGAFYNCSSLTRVTIGNSVTNIVMGAFESCISLTSVTMGNNVKSIGDWAFGGCTSLTSVTIGNSVTSIGGSAFYNCSSLTSITIPDSVTKIDVRAFGGSSLTSVYYKGTIDDWVKIQIYSNNTALTSAARYYYSENEPTDSGNYWHYDTDGITPVIWVKEN